MQKYLHPTLSVPNSKWPPNGSNPAPFPLALNTVIHDEGMGIAEVAVLLLISLSTPGDFGS